MQIRWTNDAEEDLFAIYDYIAADSRSAAEAIAKRLYDAVDSLQTMPKRGRARDNSPLRELIPVSLPYIIFYRVDPDAVVVIRIMHGAMDQLPQ